MTPAPGPALFGAAQLALALVLLWIAHWRDPPTLLSPVARVLALMLSGALLATMALGLPYSLGLCRGGLDDPLRCPLAPGLERLPVDAAHLLVVLANVTLVPLLLLAGALTELLARLWRHRR